VTALHLLALARLDVPVTITREQAAALAKIELAKPEYHATDENLAQRAFRWLLDRISDVLANVGSSSPLGWFGVAGLVLVAVLAVVVLRRRLGGLGRGAAPAALFDGAARTADDLRADAERFAASGAWAEAVRARLRATVHELEARGVLDVRPGRTADEVAVEAGRALPSVAADLRTGTRIFDDVWYGGRVADATAYARLVAVDDAVRAARPSRSDDLPAPALAVPR
jgi:hypothetical protein